MPKPAASHVLTPICMSQVAAVSQQFARTIFLDAKIGIRKQQVLAATTGLARHGIGQLSEFGLQCLQCRLATVTWVNVEYDDAGLLARRESDVRSRIGGPVPFDCLTTNRSILHTMRSFRMLSRARAIHPPRTGAAFFFHCVHREDAQALRSVLPLFAAFSILFILTSFVSPPKTRDAFRAGAKRIGMAQGALSIRVVEDSVD
jgi:hypothetical protein